MKISIVVLTYNRKEWVVRQMQMLSSLKNNNVEFIFVDNCSNDRIDYLITRDCRAKLIRNSVNEGAVGRNRGMIAAQGEIVITLDDDVYGIDDTHIDKIVELMKNVRISAINFKILEEGTSRIIDWCHPYDKEIYKNQEIETNDISDGAVAFRKEALEQVGFYPDYFFISHEGPDLALRMINAGWKIIYTPEVVVYHGYEQKERVGWRRYYYDTRNLLWLALRNYTFGYGLKKLLIGWGSLLIYSLRDGYVLYWIKGIMDSFRGIPRAWKDRTPPTRAAQVRWRLIEKYKPGFFKMVRMRLFGRNIRI